MRVYELARKLKIPTKKLLDIISKSDISNKVSLSNLSSKEIEKIKNLLRAEKPSLKKKLLPRDPVVTFLGHVDHGKTSLLDAIRNTQVAKEEFGGITQRIGASEINFQGKRIVFIDTPGHEAFTAMRAQGAQVTDIVVLVIAADDGVMPQTKEAINHARAAKVPIVVAINKIDKKEANPERVKQQLTKYDLTPEEWGGETICVPVSALTKEGINELLEMILLEAEMLELSANPKGDFKGVVIEGEVDRRKGPFSTILVKEGTLHIGDVLVGGEIWGKVRALINWQGEKSKEAGPSTPVRVLGLSKVATPGQIFIKVKNEKEARRLAEKVAEEKKEGSLSKRERLTLESIFGPEKKEKSLSIVLKTDTQGSLKAVSDTLKSLEEKDVKVNILHQGIGEVNKSDVLLASTASSIIISFNVEVSNEINLLAKEEGVEIRKYRTIYEIIDDIKLAVKGLLEPVYKDELVGKAQVRETFKIPKVGIVAGCYVMEGKVPRGSRAKVIRDKEVVGEGRIVSLKRFNQDVNEVSTGLECGINVQGPGEVQKGDIIEVYHRQRVE